MKIMLDTNVLFSGLVYGGKVAPAVVEYVSKHYDLYLSEYAVNELKKATLNKTPHQATKINEILAKLNYTLVKLPLEDPPDEYFNLRDPNDIPILQAAVDEDMDILITGDKDFEDVIIKKPQIMNMSTFADKYMKGERIYGTINSNTNMER
ncbi:MAG: putative toxin-antitoxin system toxin component, PIN family [Turicibacter sp.]|nr:putative toxin-antitoxin system toxin component, PIN family [Turicibacter sp.]